MTRGHVSPFCCQATRLFYLFHLYNEPLPFVSAVDLIACYTRKNANYAVLKLSKIIQQ